MNFGETIPAGYVVDATSWENDGDDYKTIRKTGKGEMYVAVVTALAPLLKSTNGRKGGFGNTSEGEVDEFDFIEACQKALEGLDAPYVNKELGFELMSLNLEEEFSDETLDNCFSKMKDFVRENLVGWSEWYDFRVLSKIKVYYLETAVKIPEVTLHSELSQ